MYVYIHKEVRKPATLAIKNVNNKVCTVNVDSSSGVAVAVAADTDAVDAGPVVWFNPN